MQQPQAPEGFSTVPDDSSADGTLLSCTRCLNESNTPHRSTSRVHIRSMANPDIIPTFLCMANYQKLHCSGLIKKDIKGGFADNFCEFRLKFCQCLFFRAGKIIGNNDLAVIF